MQTHLIVSRPLSLPVPGPRKDSSSVLHEDRPSAMPIKSPPRPSAIVQLFDTSTRTRLNMEKLTGEAAAEIVETVLRACDEGVTLVQKSGGRAYLHLSIALYHQHLTDNRHLEMLHLTRANDSRPGLDETFWIQQRQRQMEDESDARAGDGSNALTRVAFEKYQQDAMRAMVTASQLQVQFWSVLSQPVPDITSLHGLSSRLNRSISRAEEDFLKALRLNTSSVMLLRNYAAFEEEIVNDPENALRYFKEADMLEESLSKVRDADWFAGRVCADWFASAEPHRCERAV